MLLDDVIDRIALCGGNPSRSPKPDRGQPGQHQPTAAGGLRRVSIDLDAPALHLAIDRIAPDIVTDVVGPVAGIRDKPEALGLEPGFGLGEVSGLAGLTDEGLALGLSDSGLWGAARRCGSSRLRAPRLAILHAAD
jgi:hypothetical protein